MSGAEMDAFTEEILILAKLFTVHPDLCPEQPDLYVKLARVAQRVGDSEEVLCVVQDWFAGWPQEARLLVTAVIIDECFFLFDPRSMPKNGHNNHLFVDRGTVLWQARHVNLCAVIRIVRGVPEVWEHLQTLRQMFETRGTPLSHGS